jgi:hypothetical protein
MRRDGRIDNDDFFEIIFDTFHDQRNAYYFIINPNGVKRDATLGDEGKSYNPNWDGIWDCETQISDEGWFAEIAIPWKTLRFDSGRDSLWGVNFARMIRRKNEHVFWKLISRDAGRGGLFRVSQAGVLRGLSNLQSGRTIDFLPYLMGGLSKNIEIDSTYSQVKEIGLDATIAITSNINLKLSWNTDFAQVESDQERVNLTRFSLYFPEKREFFLDGAEIFNFAGAGMGGRRQGGGGSTTLNLFYSRRIGILEGHQQPIMGGMKLLGKVGSFDIRTLGCRIYYFFSTNLYVKAYLQWKDDKKANDGNRIALSNILFRWIHRPGSDIYLVYNEGWNIGPLGNQMSNRSILLKFTYFWRN